MEPPKMVPKLIDVVVHDTTPCLDPYQIIVQIRFVGVWYKL